MPIMMMSTPRATTESSLLMGGVLEELVGGRFRGQGHRGGRIDDEVQPLVAQDLRLVIPMPADVIRYNW